jgi:hypothetical protein
LPKHVTTATKPIIPRVAVANINKIGTGIKTCFYIKKNEYYSGAAELYKTADSNCSYRRPVRITRCMLAMHSSLKNKFTEQISDSLK